MGLIDGVLDLIEVNRLIQHIKETDVKPWSDATYKFLSDRYDHRQVEVLIGEIVRKLSSLAVELERKRKG